MSEIDNESLKKTTLTMLLYGDAKVGKSQLADTAPGPRLIIDVENGTDDTPSRKIKWDPRTDPNKLNLGPDDSAIVRINDLNDYKLFGEIKSWLQTGKHPFRSVVIDSFMALQKKQIETTAGGGTYQLTFQGWGDVLYKFESLSHTLQDLTRKDGNKLMCAILIAGTEVNPDSGRIEPFFKGQLKKTIPYIPDVIGYLQVYATEDGTERRLMIDPNGKAVGGSRKSVLPKTYGIYISNPNLLDMVKLIDKDRKERLALQTQETS